MTKFYLKFDKDNPDSYLDFIKPLKARWWEEWDYIFPFPRQWTIRGIRIGGDYYRFEKVPLKCRYHRFLQTLKFLLR